MERFEFVCNLGEGAYGTVWKCRDRETEQMVAMKRFKDAHVDEEVMRLALREIRILKGAHHPNIVKMLEAFRSKSGRVYLVMEFVEHTLTEELRRNPRGFSPDQLKLVTWQLLQATSYLHKSRVIHRDLKPANILLNPNGEVKLCDFGFARNMVSKETAEYTSYVVTRWYRPPEILVNDMYGPAVDVWAIGCLFAEMATGRPLFPGRNTLDQLWLTVRTLGRLTDRQMALMQQDPKLCTINVPPQEELHSLSRRFPEFTPSMMQVLRACLDPDPEQRLTAAQVMQLPYFFDIDKVIARNAAANAKVASPPSPCISDASPPPTLFMASGSNTCSRGSSLDCGSVGSTGYHSSLQMKHSMGAMKPSVPATVPESGSETGSAPLVAPQAAAPSASAASSMECKASAAAMAVPIVQRQPSNLSTSSCVRPLSELSTFVSGRMSVDHCSTQQPQAQQSLQRAGSAALPLVQQAVHRSASVGISTRDAQPAPTTTAASATTSPSAIKAGGAVVGPTVVVDARGSQLSRMASANSNSMNAVHHADPTSTHLMVPFAAAFESNASSTGHHIVASHLSTGDCEAKLEHQMQGQGKQSEPMHGSMDATSFYAAKHLLMEQQSQSRRRSFGQAVRALGAKLEAFVHRPFTIGSPQ